MRNIVCIILGVWLTTSTLSAQDYLTKNDSLVVSINEYGQKVFCHTLTKGQTLYSLTRFYGQTLADLYHFNTALEPSNIHQFGNGDSLYLELPNRMIFRHWKGAYSRDSFATIYYKVKRGDTYYRIANTHFKMPLDLLKERNKSKGNTLKVGQLLKIGWVHIGGWKRVRSRNKPSNVNLGPLNSKNEANKRVYTLQKNSKREFMQRGQTVWAKGESMGAAMVCLHRSAPEGSYIRLYNPTSQRTAYLKVIGRIPAKIFDKNVLVVIPPKVAEALKAKSMKFYSEVFYLK